MLYNQMDTVSKQQHNDVQGMTLKNKNVEKTHFQLQDETNTQPLILIDNHTTRNSKGRVYHTRELDNVVTSGKDCQSIQGASRNQIDEASNKKDIGLQGLTSTTTFNNNPHVENDFMDEESNQDVDSESESLDVEKKTRGPTFMKEIWGRPNTLPRIKIRCDDMGRPIGSRRNKFTDFLGTLARNAKFCPIDVEDWQKMPLDSKKKMLDVIKIGCSVSIKSLFDSTKIVAKGVVRSMDPNTEVGGQTLGPNWCEIQVLVVLEREESLIRPYDLLQKVGDTLGGMIAWPCHLLMRKISTRCIWINNNFPVYHLVTRILDFD
ncbi:uncharacterized protein [Primulina huaijiensis]